MESLQKLLKLTDIGVIYPGHGPVVEDGRSKLEEYYRHRMERESQILQHLEETKPITIPEIVQKIYASYPANLQKAAEGNVWLHLEKLRLENKVQKINDSWVLSKL
jgi:glyoxylase-like metal-dependent hydrolase (beta-lactamase superfamily II)